MIEFEIHIMTKDLLPMVMEIEGESHIHPWTIKNFEDSIDAGYWAYIFRSRKSQQKSILGHMVFMPGVEELHLLNITISKIYRRNDIAKRALLAIEPIALEKNLTRIFLEVRVSNLPAINLYRSLQYEEISLRKGYYPSLKGLREDALVMSKQLIRS